jgi:hypothetical protein
MGSAVADYPQAALAAAERALIVAAADFGTDVIAGTPPVLARAALDAAAPLIAAASVEKYRLGLIAFANQMRRQAAPEATGVCASCRKPIKFLPDAVDLPGGRWHHMSGAEALACHAVPVVPAPEEDQ